MVGLIVNIDVDDLARGEAFYTAAFGLRVGRRFGGGMIELLGLEAPLYLLEKPADHPIAPNSLKTRDYRRHWTPIHLDIGVNEVVNATARALAAGAVQEGETRTALWGKIAMFADPFGHGFCLIEFTPEGYDAIAA